MWSAKIHFTRRNCVYILWAPIIKTVNRNAWISVVTCVLCHPLIPALFNIHVFSRAFWKVRWNKFSVWLATAAFVGGKNSCRNLMMVVKKNSLQMALICRIEWKFTANLGCGVNVCVCVSVNLRGLATTNIAEPTNYHICCYINETLGLCCLDLVDIFQSEWHWNSEPPIALKI